MKISTAVFLLLLSAVGCAAAQEVAEGQAVLYKRIGVSLGTPAGLNGALVVETKWTSISVSGMRWNSSEHNSKGVQFGLSLLRHKNRKDFVALNIMAGSSRVYRKKWDYWGLDAVGTVGWLFLQPGITIGKGSFDSPQLSLQMGLLFPL